MYVSNTCCELFPSYYNIYIYVYTEIIRKTNSILKYILNILIFYSS